MFATRVSSATSKSRRVWPSRFKNPRGESSTRSSPETRRRRSPCRTGRRSGFGTRQSPTTALGHGLRSLVTRGAARYARLTRSSGETSVTRFVVPSMRLSSARIPSSCVSRTSIFSESAFSISVATTVTCLISSSTRATCVVRAGSPAMDAGSTRERRDVIPTASDGPAATRSTWAPSSPASVSPKA